jgi:hypothetical protein
MEKDASKVSKNKGVTERYQKETASNDRLYIYENERLTAMLILYILAKGGHEILDFESLCFFEMASSVQTILNMAFRERNCFETIFIGNGFPRLIEAMKQTTKTDSSGSYQPILKKLNGPNAYIIDLEHFEIGQSFREIIKNVGLDGIIIGAIENAIMDAYPEQKVLRLPV